MSKIVVDGNQFHIESHRGKGTRPYLMASSFCLLSYYQRGFREKARSWLDRLRQIGFDGPRLFGENQDWFVDGGGDFFGNSSYTSEVHVMGSQTHGDSSLEPNSAYRNIVEQLAEDLRARNMIAEFVMVATVKGRDESVTSNLLNGYARMFRSSFGGDTPFLHETVNEVLAHSRISAEEASRYGTRWKRSNPQDPSHHNYPGSTIGQSDGGTLSPGFDMGGFTHVNIHPPRGPRWYETDFEDIRVKYANKPVALNETVCVLSQAQWDAHVVPGHFGGNQCTTNAARAVQYLRDAYNSGLSVCAHYYEGMSTNPDLPLSDYEKRIADEFGSGIVVSQPKQEYRHIVISAYMDILMRPPDPDGLEAFNAAMKSGMSETAMRAALMTSKEFQERFL